MSSAFPVFQYINGSCSSPLSVAFPFCLWSSFAPCVAGFTLPAYHPLLTVIFRLDREFSSQGSDCPGPPLLCSRQYEALLYNVLGVNAIAGSSGRDDMLDPLLPSSCSTEITMRQEDLGFFYSVLGRVEWLNVGVLGQRPMYSFKLDICCRTGSKAIPPCYSAAHILDVPCELHLFYASVSPTLSLHAHAIFLF